MGCQALVLGRVVAASAREGLTALLQRLPNRPMTAGLVTKLKKFVELAKDFQRHEGGNIWSLKENGKPGKVPQAPIPIGCADRGSGR